MVIGEKVTRMVFMGTGEFAVDSLRAADALAGFEIVGVYTKPAGRVGRGRGAIADNPVRAYATEHNIPIFDPADSLKTEENLAQLVDLAPDIIVVAAYGKILPQVVLDLPIHGCVNVHASLLPRWRGASPIHHAIMAGDTQTGVTIMQMDAGLDTGPILASFTVPIGANTRTSELFAQLATSGGKLLAEILPQYIDSTIKPITQPLDGVTTCRTLTRDDGQIDWTNSAQNIFNQFRALTPWPGVFTHWQRGDTTIRIKLLDLSIADANIGTISSHAPGTVFTTDTSIAIATGNSAIILHQLQRDGKPPTATRDFINGASDFVGAILC